MNPEYGRHYNAIIYLWINQINGKRYLGSHMGSVDDGYIGSGVVFRKAVKKYGLQNFERTILNYAFVENKRELHELEQFYLNKLDVVIKDIYYNLTDSAGGGYCLDGKTEEEKREIYHKIGYKSKIFWERSSDEYKQSVRDRNSRMNSGKNNPMYGRRGQSNVCSKPVIVNGEYFNSVSECCSVFNIGRTTAWRRLKSKRDKWSNWNYA